MSSISDEPAPATLVMTVVRGSTIELVSGYRLHVVEVTSDRLTVRVGEDAPEGIGMGESASIPGGRILFVDILRGDRARLGFRPGSMVARPLGDAHGVEPRRRVRRTVACVVLLVPVALAFTLGAFVVIEAILGGSDLRGAKIAMGVTAMLGTGVFAVWAFAARSVTRSIIALAATPIVLFIARLVGFGASEW